MRLAAIALSSAMLLLPLNRAAADDVLPVFPAKLDFTFQKNNSAYGVVLRFESRQYDAQVSCEGAVVGAARIDLSAQLNADANIVGADLESAEAIPKCSKDFVLRIYVRNFDAPGAEEIAFHDLVFSGGKLLTFGK